MSKEGFFTHSAQIGSYQNIANRQLEKNSMNGRKQKKEKFLVFENGFTALSLSRTIYDRTFLDKTTPSFYSPGKSEN